MDRDTFIITVYCLVEDECKKRSATLRVRHAGFTPEWRDAEVITLEICGEYCKQQTDKDLCGYFAQHDRHFFPQLSDRRLFVRQAANLWQFKAAFHRRLTSVSGQATAPIQPRLTRCTSRCLPLPALTATGVFRGKLGLRIARCGMRIHFPLLAARPHDLHHLEALVADFCGIAPADKGFIKLLLQQQLAQEQGVSVVTPRKKNRQTSRYPAQLVKACARWRKLVETVGSHLTERFAVHRIRVHDLWHFQPRLIRKVLAHTVAVFLPRTLGRQPLDVDGLVAS